MTMPAKPTLKPGDLLTSAEVAELCNVSEQSVRRWRFDGDLPFVQLGYRTIRHRRSDVLAFLESRRTSTVTFGARDPERPATIVPLGELDD